MDESLFDELFTEKLEKAAEGDIAALQQLGRAAADYLRRPLYWPEVDEDKINERIALIVEVLVRRSTQKLVCPACERLGNETLRYPLECPKHGCVLEER